MACSFLCLVERTNFFVSTLCVPFYILFLLSIGQALRQPDRIQRVTSFYWLVISAGVADLWYLLHYYLLNKFRKWGWLIWPAEVMPYYSFMAALVLQQSQVLATLLMGVNRLFAVCWPIRYQVLWTDSLTLKTVALQWLFSLITVIPPGIECKVRVPENNTDGMIENKQTCAKFVFGIQVTTQLTAAIALLVLYAVMFLRMRKQSTKVGTRTTHSKTSRGTQQDRKAQYNLAIAGGVISAVLILYASSSAALPAVAFNPKLRGVKPVIGLMYNLTSTLLSIINPFILVAMCTNMRKGMRRLCYMAVGKQLPQPTMVKKSHAARTTGHKKNEECEIK